MSCSGGSGERVSAQTRPGRGLGASPAGVGGEGFGASSPVAANGRRRLPAPRDRLLREEFEGEALHHLEAVHRFALKLTSGAEAEAEDLVQEAYLRAYRRWHTYEAGTNCRAWLMTILYRLHVDWRRREKFRAACGNGVLEELAGCGGEDVEAAVFDAVVDEEVEEALRQLPEKLRVVVTLSDIEGLRYAEVADVLGVPEGTVKSRLSRARAQLRRSLLRYARERGFVRATAEVSRS